ncbi:protein SODIUM POTASSIUM ROOT DEFECTIVE 2-like [Phragmites australis]|uniref:protein SODIUM POTASSIUM ROOT DEFECTIVE 2-like n=1 Tax=Phragmites australis TaxID=29695 RepID=UPI002D7A393F|nr:protein SODIUM POTASSIUM ROOT DEFECTIVE 2-like [Phragmites australis]
MRAGGMLCRSQAATAVCVPGDARSMVVARRADRTIIAEDARALHDVRYARLGGEARATSRRYAVTRAPRPPPPPPPPTAAATRPRGERRRGGRAPVAVTLPMVTKSPSRETPARELAAAAKRAPAATAAAIAPPGDQVLQVVVMKVAIHCQGCAGKVRKHISKMEGVTSFSIDLESKKVTVMGHVSPAGVLESISKVKKAELLI